MRSGALHVSMAPWLSSLYALMCMCIGSIWLIGLIRLYGLKESICLYCVQAKAGKLWRTAGALEL